MDWRIWRFKRRRKTENIISDGMFLEVEIDIADDFTDGVILEIEKFKGQKILLWGLCIDRR